MEKLNAKCNVAENYEEMIVSEDQQSEMPISMRRVKKSFETESSHFHENLGYESPSLSDDNSSASSNIRKSHSDSEQLHSEKAFDVRHYQNSFNCNEDYEFSLLYFASGECRIPFLNSSFLL